MTGWRRWIAPPFALPVLAIARLALVGRFDLAPDEAYYLTWARGAPGPDHPPLIAWLARLALALGTFPLERAARLVPVTCALAALLALDALLRALGGSVRARWVLLAVSLLPLPAAGALLLTPDAPLLACVAGALFVTLAPGGGPRLRALALGALSAAAVLAKVHALVLLPTLFIARQALGDRAPALPRGTWVLALAAQSAALIPALASLRFQLVHAFTAHGPAAGLAAAPPFPLAGVPIFVSGQLALLLPALGLVPRRARTPATRALALATLLPCAPVLVSALVRIPEPNWTAPGYPALLTWLALASDALPAVTVRRWTALTLAVALALHIQLVRPWLPLAPAADPTARLRGWRRWTCDRGPLPAQGLPPYALPAERAVYAPTCPTPREAPRGSPPR